MSMRIKGGSPGQPHTGRSSGLREALNQMRRPGSATSGGGFPAVQRQVEAERVAQTPAATAPEAVPGAGVANRGVRSINPADRALFSQMADALRARNSQVQHNGGGGPRRPTITLED